MVSADHFDPALIGRAHRAIDPIHSQLYFAPEHDEHLSAIGLRPGGCPTSPAGPRRWAPSGRAW